MDAVRCLFMDKYTKMKRSKAIPYNRSINTLDFLVSTKSPANVYSRENEKGMIFILSIMAVVLKLGCILRSPGKFLKHCFRFILEQLSQCSYGDGD